LDGEEFLFDYAGNLLMQSQENSGEYETQGVFYLSELWDYSTRFRTLYLPYITQHDGMTVAYAQNQGLSVYTEAGKHLASITVENLWQYNMDVGKIIIRSKDGHFLIVYADGLQKQISLPEAIRKENLRNFRYTDGTLLFDGSSREYTFSDSDRHLDEAWLNPLGPGRCYAVSDGHRSALKDADGNTLFPFGVYDEYICGDLFALACKGTERGTQQIDIINDEGELMLENVLGANFREPSFPDSMVVWLDEINCVMLHRDGSTSPIPTNMAVERRYPFG
jgi:hypothetical protein